MKTKINYFFILFALVAFQKTAKAQLAYFGANYSAGIINNSIHDNNVSNLLIMDNPAYNIYKGINFGFGRYPFFNIGLGYTSGKFESEIQGLFPETNQYGIAVIYTNLNYWSFPISLHFITKNKTIGMFISYTPNIIAYSGRLVKKYGGAESSVYLSNYHEDYSVFQHSMICSLNLNLGNTYSAFGFSVNPYIGIGSGFFRNQKQIISTLTYGVNISCLIETQGIHINWRTNNNYKKDQKEKELKKKQKEIEEKLNKNLKK